MLEQEKMDKLRKLLGIKINELEQAVATAKEYYEGTKSAYKVSNSLEEIGVTLNGLTQVIGLLGYFEMLEEASENGDTDPLDRMEL